MQDDFIKLAKKLELPKAESTKVRVITESLREHLESRADWLLIFDNAETPEALKDYLPRAASGHTLITSRHRNWGPSAQVLEVRPLEAMEARQFLLDRTGSGDEDAAATLAEMLGCLPLALEQTAAYINNAVISLTDYLVRFEKSRLALLAKGAVPEDLRYGTVATTWNVTIEKIRQVSPRSIDFLGLLTCFASDNIPRALFSEQAEKVPEPLRTTLNHPLELDEVIGSLRGYSLLEAGIEMLSLHRLVQTVVQDNLPEDQLKQWVEATIRMMDNAFPSTDPPPYDVWPDCARLVPHVLVAAKLAGKLEVALDLTSHILYQAALYLREIGDLAEAKTYVELALMINTKKFGPDHPEVAKSLSHLGTVLPSR